MKSEAGASMFIRDLRGDEGLARAVYDDLLEPLFPAGELIDRRAMIEAYARATDPPPHAVAIDDGRPIAVALTERFAASDVLLLTYLAVRPDRQGDGLGGRLLDDHLARWAAETEPQLVLAEVEDPRQHAASDVADPADRLRFYGRHGARVLAMPYVQPALHPGAGRVRGMLLLSLAPTARGVVGDAGGGDAGVRADVVRAFLEEYVVGTEGEAALRSDPEVLALLAHVPPGDALVPTLRVEQVDAVPPLGAGIGPVTLLARAIVRRGGDHTVPTIVAAALASLDGAAGPTAPGAAALLGAVIAHLDDARDLDDEAPEATGRGADGRFLGPDDRWAGWWADDDVSWPVGTPPKADDVVSALRRLPLPHRVLIVGADAGGLTGDDLAPLVGLRPGADVRPHLAAARTAFVEHLAHVVRRPADAR
jgi:GNAT superfamily N-acetyltransferase